VAEREQSIRGGLQLTDANETKTTTDSGNALWQQDRRAKRKKGGAPEGGRREKGRRHGYFHHSINAGGRKMARKTQVSHQERCGVVSREWR